jgi:hypothetical protein
MAKPWPDRVQEFRERLVIGTAAFAVVMVPLVAVHRGPLELPFVAGMLVAAGTTWVFDARSRRGRSGLTWLVVLWLLVALGFAISWEYQSVGLPIGLGIDAVATAAIVTMPRAVRRFRQPERQASQD